MREKTQIKLAKRSVLRTRLHVTLQGLEVLIKASFILGIELQHPRVLVQLVKTILQRVLQRIARLCQPGGLPAFGAQRNQLKKRPYRLAVLQQHADRKSTRLTSSN